MCASMTNIPRNKKEWTAFERAARNRANAKLPSFVRNNTIALAKVEHEVNAGGCAGGCGRRVSGSMCKSCRATFNKVWKKGI